jgi:hypothetical protein
MLAPIASGASAEARCPHPREWLSGRIDQVGESAANLRRSIFSNLIM